MTPGRALALLIAVVGAVLLGTVHPVLALGPLVCPGLPAALLAYAGRGGRDPYDVSHRYR